jgi:hypothetical protein
MSLPAEALKDQHVQLRARIAKAVRSLCQAYAEDTMCTMTSEARAGTLSLLHIMHALGNERIF